MPVLCLWFKASDGSVGSVHLGASKPRVMSIWVIHCLREAVKERTQSLQPQQ